MAKRDRTYPEASISTLKEIKQDPILTIGQQQIIKILGVLVFDDSPVCSHTDNLITRFTMITKRLVLLQTAIHAVAPGVSAEFCYIPPGDWKSTPFDVSDYNVQEYREYSRLARLPQVKFGQVDTSYHLQWIRLVIQPMDVHSALAQVVCVYCKETA
ncbi:hypothetical protein PCANC_13619 [Puccinia coronata f. sp. avenae]|uniref:Uncharacterized protein n=1 Tax=Puccinia coronata f. sp. avenae TaxID=200324 RepID=A0A2N5UKD2_9BASI|nr:hypothetical protein PCANC_13619 [Puccinia coronata f. sp. avenae]